MYFSSSKQPGVIVEDGEDVKAPTPDCRGGCGAQVVEDGDYCKACEGSGREDEVIVHPKIGA